MKAGIFFLICYSAISCHGQTCCTGGTSLLGTYSFFPFKKGDIYLHSSYNYNKNKDLVLGRDQLNSFIQRDIQTVFFQTDYAINDFIVVSVIFPFLIQKETISSRQGTFIGEFENFGLGDISLWGRYQLNRPSVDLGIAVGIKLPNGKTNSRLSNGVVLPFSMQLGSGSYDLACNIKSSIFLFENKKISQITQLDFKINSSGKGFNAHPFYKFGNQYQFLHAFSYKYSIEILVSQPYVGFVYQFRKMDQFGGGFLNENTGGNWVNLVAGQNTSISPNLGIGINLLLPLYRDLNGLQLTTTWQGAIQISYLIRRKDEMFSNDF